MSAEREQALRIALANKDGIIEDFLAQLENGHVELNSEGGWEFSTEEGLSCEVVFDGMVGDGIDATIYATDSDIDQVELTTVRLTVEVLP